MNNYYMKYMMQYNTAQYKYEYRHSGINPTEFRSHMKYITTYENKMQFQQQQCQKLIKKIVEKKDNVKNYYTPERWLPRYNTRYHSTIKQPSPQQKHCHNTKNKNPSATASTSQNSHCTPTHPTPKQPSSNPTTTQHNNPTTIKPHNNPKNYLISTTQILLNLTTIQTTARPTMQSQQAPAVRRRHS